MKNLKILFIVLLILVVGYFALSYFSRPDDFVAPSDFKTSEWKADQFDELRLVFGGGKQLTFTFKEGKWLVNGYPAESGQMDLILGALDKARVTSRVSTNKQHHERFEVDGKGMELSLLKKDQLIQKMIVGKTAGGDNVYVRLPDQDEVYVLSDFPSWVITEEIDTWRDRRVASFKADQARKLDYTFGRIRYSLEKKGEEYSFGLPGALMAVDKDKAKSWLETASGLSAATFPTPEELKTLTDKKLPMSTVVFELGSEETFTGSETWKVFVVPSGANTDKYLIVRESDGLGYFVSKETFAQSFKSFEEVKKQMMVG